MKVQMKNMVNPYNTNVYSQNNKKSANMTNMAYSNNVTTFGSSNGWIVRPIQSAPVLKTTQKLIDRTLEVASIRQARVVRFFQDSLHAFEKEAEKKYDAQVCLHQGAFHPEQSLSVSPQGINKDGYLVTFLDNSDIQNLKFPEKYSLRFIKDDTIQGFVYIMQGNKIALFDNYQLGETLRGQNLNNLVQENLRVVLGQDA